MSLPRYDEERTEIVGPGSASLCGFAYVIPLCGSGVVEEADEVYVEDCAVCLARNGGCFHAARNDGARVSAKDGRLR